MAAARGVSVDVKKGSPVRVWVSESDESTREDFILLEDHGKRMIRMSRVSGDIGTDTINHPYLK